MRIRWSENDRYFGPFTYAREAKYRAYRPIAIMLGSGDSDDYPGCRLRFSAFGHTLIIAMPAIIKPWRQKVEYSSPDIRARVQAEGRATYYIDQHEREYGFTMAEGALHLHYGPQTHDSETTRSSCWFFPWREHRMVRHSLYDLEGQHFADLPQGRPFTHNRYTAQQALQSACPVAQFHFLDFDGENIVATCRIEEREWKRGKGLFRLLFLGRNPINRALDLQFSAEVGKRKGSWKGGTVGHSIAMLPGELHEAAFRRYCTQQELTFVEPQPTPAAQPDRHPITGEPLS